ncbi:MAG: AAA family ATPase [Lachnospiraceae bacterium]|nr:AAA family ATPase [Lachnospiraceae bacterium]MBQ6996579.1 AAA family ATPase [Lachnospiraceae bacterium]
MARNVAIGIQDFEKIRKGNCFYVDKTHFIKEWWDSADDVTLIARPRRFGKTLNMSMLEQFFSVDYDGRSDLFEGLTIWQQENYRQIQGTYPVISLSFANIKEDSFLKTKEKINKLITDLYIKYEFLLESDALANADKDFFCRILQVEIRETDATVAIHQLAKFLYKYYGKKAIILLDEYDTPMQEAYVNGYWDELVTFTRSLFNATFKTNPYLERALMTGITRVSKESIFSDLNNLKVVTATSDEYATSFGFTEDEVFAALEECGLGEHKDGVKAWYDGFIFGKQGDIYNPWSVLNFLDTNGVYDTYWANTSGNRLVGKLLQEGNKRIKLSFEALLKGEIISSPVEEQIVYSQLGDNEMAVWSLLLASGYLKVIEYEKQNQIPIGRKPNYKLMLTNGEVRRMFYSMVHDWFMETESDYNDFVLAMFCNDIEEMNAYMNKVTRIMFSYFDTGRNAEEAEPERFYHGFVLGLMAELSGEYVVTSNRESGFGRYDVMLEPCDKSKKAYILEFKVHKPKREKTMEETVENALKQIEEKQYEADLIARGIPKENIYKYGFAFRGKEVLIGNGNHS